MPPATWAAAGASWAVSTVLWLCVLLVALVCMDGACVWPWRALWARAPVLAPIALAVGVAVAHARGALEDVVRRVVFASTAIPSVLWLGVNAMLMFADVGASIRNPFDVDDDGPPPTRRETLLAACVCTAGAVASWWLCGVLARAVAAWVARGVAWVAWLVVGRREKRE